MEEVFKAYCLPIILGCVPLSINYLISRKKEKLDEKKRLTYLAVRVSVWLEEFTLWAIGAYDEWSSYLLVKRGKPSEKFIAFSKACPEDVDWTVADVELTNKVFTFGNYLIIAGSGVESQRDKYDSEAILERLLMLMTTASQAYALARLFRNQIGDQSPQLRYYEDSLSRMTESYEKYTAYQKNGFFQSEAS